MDLIRDLGELALGSRLRRLSDYIMRNGVDVYREYGIDFDPKWFPVFYALGQAEKPLAIMELAQLLQVTHPGIIKIGKELDKAGLIVSLQDPEDKRRRLLTLSEHGVELLTRMEVAWRDIARSLHQLLEPHTHHLLRAIEEVEDGFSRKPFLQRIREVKRKRQWEEVEIIDYQPEYAEEFKRINYAWINKYFKVEQPDIDSLDRHQEKIIDRGGWICLARIDQRIVGACALINHREGVFELAKMGVDDGYQGRQIGKRLGQAVIDKARSMDGRRLFLESNRKLLPAIGLYRKLGFREVVRRQGKSEYERSDIVMELYL